jgi:hypothetical protein
MTGRQRIIGGLLLTGIGIMVLASNSKRPVKPKDGMGSDESQDDGSPTLRHGVEMSTPDPDQPANGAHPRAVSDLTAHSDRSDAAIDLTTESVVDPDRFTPPSVAPTVLSKGQKVAILLGLVALAGGFTVAPVITIVALNGVVVAFYIASNSMKVFLITRALNDPRTVRVHAASDRIPDDQLPVYTILLPVYREAALLAQLVDGIQALDYPDHRLDVKLLLEEDDVETRDAAADMDLPDCFDVSVVPAVGPTGKPRACNHGLANARGEYLVIFDAEDRPEADQLRRSVLAFRETSPEVVCLQAQLNYFNRTRNLLTRWFTAEYSVWFDQLLPGLQGLDVVIPLGGTSNHFITARLREIGGWNAFNVTEDADLGLRIFLRGWKTAILATTTYEEALPELDSPAEPMGEGLRPDLPLPHAPPIPTGRADGSQGFRGLSALLWGKYALPPPQSRVLGTDHPVVRLALPPDPSRIPWSGPVPVHDRTVHRQRRLRAVDGERLLRPAQLRRCEVRAFGACLLGADVGGCLEGGRTTLL